VDWKLWNGIFTTRVKLAQRGKKKLLALKAKRKVVPPETIDHINNERLITHNPSAERSLACEIRDIGFRVKAGLLSW
jgi:hypothetical protein